MSSSSRPPSEVSLAGDLRTILRVLRAKALWIVLCTVIALLLGFLHLRSSPRIYAARTIIQVEQEEKKVVKIEGVHSEDLKSLEVLKTIEQSIVSPEVLLRVIHNHELFRDPAFLPEVTGPTSDSALQEALARHIQAKIRRGTRLIDIQVEHQKPLLAQRIATLLVEEFARWNFAVQREAGQMASNFLLEEAERLKARLAKSEQAIQLYKEQHETVSLEDKQNIVVEKLKELNLRVTEAKAVRLKLESDCSQLSADLKHPAAFLLQIPSIANAPEIAALKKSISDREASLGILAQRYKPEHPKYLEAAGELATLRADLEESARKSAHVLASTYEGAMLNERKLEEALREQQVLALDLNKIAIPYAVLARDMESDRALYDSVLTRLKETDITKDIAQDAVRLVARPLLPDRPIKPRRSLTLALSLLGGLGIGCGLAFATYAADPSLRSLPEAEARLGLRSIGEIPKLPKPKRRRGRKPLLASPESLAAECFRSLRTSLAVLGPDAGPKTVLFTSAHSAEGKTFCAINAAISFAQAGLKTLIVDADFQFPQVGQAFFDPQAARNLHALRPEGPAWETSIQASPIEHLSVLALAQSDLDQSEFFNPKTLSHFLAWVSGKFDRVVFDTAPVLLVSDTLLLAKYVQAVCLVIHAGRTPAEDVERATQRLNDAGAPLVGFIWNQVKAGSGFAYERATSSRSAAHGSSEAARPASTALAKLDPLPRFEVTTNGEGVNSGQKPRRG